ncbi:MAG: zinc-binding dehydrogenase, partial [Lachnospiraceae bacterium]|nr:zinc-binding dehydrogenase [Lachnospiraceae bacterium]
ITVPSYVLYPLPDNVSFVAASLVEPMSVAYHAIVQAPLPQKGAALVMGCGTIGVLAVLILKGLGVENIIAVDIEPRRLALAKESGATLVINSRTEPLAEIVKEATGGKGVEVAYDMTGIELTVNQCVELAQDNGYIVLVGNLNPTISFPMVKTILKQLKVHGSCASAGEYTQCLEMIASGKVDTEKIVSKCVPLAEGNEWIHKVYNREDQLDKIVLIP